MEPERAIRGASEALSVARKGLLHGRPVRVRVLVRPVWARVFGRPVWARVFGRPVRERVFGRPVRESLPQEDYTA